MLRGIFIATGGTNLKPPPALASASTFRHADTDVTVLLQAIILQFTSKVIPPYTPASVAAMEAVRADLVYKAAPEAVRGQQRLVNRGATAKDRGKRLYRGPDTKLDHLF